MVITNQNKLFLVVSDLNIHHVCIYINTKSLPPLSISSCTVTQCHVIGGRDFSVYAYAYMVNVEMNAISALFKRLEAATSRKIHIQRPFLASSS